MIAQSYHHTYGLPVGDRPLRQHLRRRRSQLEPDRARHDPLAPARTNGPSCAATAASCGTTSTSAMPRRHTCPSPEAGSRWTASPATAFNFSDEAPLTVSELVRRSRRVHGADGDRADRARGRPSVRSRTQIPLGREGARRCSAGSPRYDRRPGLDETIDWYRESPWSEPESCLVTGAAGLPGIAARAPTRGRAARRCRPRPAGRLRRHGRLHRRRSTRSTSRRVVELGPAPLSATVDRSSISRRAGVPRPRRPLRRASLGRTSSARCRASLGLVRGAGAVRSSLRLVLRVRAGAAPSGDRARRGRSPSTAPQGAPEDCLREALLARARLPSSSVIGRSRSTGRTRPLRASCRRSASIARGDGRHPLDQRRADARLRLRRRCRRRRCRSPQRRAVGGTFNLCHGRSRRRVAGARRLVVERLRERRQARLGALPYRRGRTVSDSPATPAHAASSTGGAQRRRSATGWSGRSHGCRDHRLVAAEPTRDGGRA